MDHQKKQESSRKASISALLTLKTYAHTNLSVVIYNIFIHDYQKTSKCASIHEWIKTGTSTQRNFFLMIKRKLSHKETWMNLKLILLCEI